MPPQPNTYLKDPTPIDSVPDLVENILGGSQYISVSYWLGEAAELATGTNPWAWIAEQFAGDWESISKAGQALSNLDEYSAGYAATLRDGITGVGHTWDGRAAEAADAYFTEFATAVGLQADTIGRIGDQLQTMATGMYETAQAIKGLWEFLLDLLIAIALEMAAAATTSVTVIGPVVAGLAAVATITKAMGVWGDVLTYHSHAWNATQATIGIIAGSLGGLHELATHKLPAAAYEHPGVAR